MFHEGGGFRERERKEEELGLYISRCCIVEKKDVTMTCRRNHTLLLISAPVTEIMIFIIKKWGYRTSTTNAHYSSFIYKAEKLGVEHWNAIKKLKAWWYWFSQKEFFYYYSASACGISTYIAFLTQRLLFSNLRITTRSTKKSEVVIDQVDTQFNVGFSHSVWGWLEYHQNEVFLFTNPF